MDWIKQNLVWVAGGVVALVLLAFAGFFLYSKYTLEAEVSANLQAQTDELDRLSRLKPHPGDRKVDNIKAAQEQEAELKALAKQLRDTIVPINYPTNLDSGQLRLLLDSTLDDLQRSAQRSGVKIPSNFGFGFSSQRTQVSFEQNVIQPLAFAIEEVRALSRVLFNARVLTFDSIRRVPIGASDGGLVATVASLGGSDTWPKKPTTNEWAILTPYELTFHSFTPELAAVLQGLAHSPHGFLVKNIQVDTVPSSLLETNTMESPMMPMPMLGAGGMSPAMMARYGLGGRYGRPGLFPGTPPPEEATPTGPTPTRRGGLNIMVEEKPFRVILWVDVLRLIDPAEARPSRGRSRVVPTAEGSDAAAGTETSADATAQ
ncbi:MAG: hypothetical protein IPM17_08655 [Verrucomicrobia bacterium]|nr:hypothetical protein [Verrucomicrobiota bacterium]